MRRLQRGDVVLLVTLLPCWAVVFALHARQVAGGRLAWVPVFVSSPATAADLPIVQGFWPGVGPAGTGLQLGDRLVRAGSADLAGRGPIGVFARIEEQAGDALDVPIAYLRGNAPGATVLRLVPVPFAWRTIPLSLPLAVVAVLVLLQRPGTAVARAFFLAAFAYCFHWAFFFGGPRIQNYAWAAILLGSSLTAFPLVLRVPMLFPPEVAPRDGPLPRWPWLFTIIGPLVFSYVFGTPFPAEVGRQGLFVANVAFIIAFLAVLTRNMRRAGPIGRRQLKWVLYGVYVGTVPVLAADVVTAIFPRLWWLHDAAVIAEGLIPICILIAIVRFNLFDIDRLISGAALYSVLLVLLLASLPTIVLPFSRVVSASVGIEPVSAQLVLSGLFASVLVWARDRVRPYVDRTFFPERRRLAGRMNHLLQELSRAGDPQVLLHTAVDGLHALLEPAACAAYFRTSDVFVRMRAAGGTTSAVPFVIEPGSALADALERSTEPLDLQGTSAAGSVRAARRVEPLGREVSVALPVHRGELLTSFILLGRKRSGDVYTATDLGLLAAVGHSVSFELLRLDLERYTPSKLPTIIRRRPEELEPRTREVTVLFSDIRDSTAIAERLSPAAFRDLHQHYFAKMDEIICRHDGVLVKTIGDALMALWNAPEPVEDHEARCCHVALEMLAALADLNAAWGERGWPMVDLRIGVVSGEAVVGVFGTTRHVEYDARGDTVNLASRLEGLNKTYGTRVLLSGATREAIEDRFVCRPLDRVRVVGRRRPVEVAELLGLRTDDRDGQLVRLADAFAVIMAAYRRRAFGEAMALLESFLHDHPNDRPAAHLVERCRAHRATPPDSDWDAVFEPGTK